MKLSVVARESISLNSDRKCEFVSLDGCENNKCSRSSSNCNCKSKWIATEHCAKGEIFIHLLKLEMKEQERFWRFGNSSVSWNRKNVVKHTVWWINYHFIRIDISYLVLIYTPDPNFVQCRLIFNRIHLTNLILLRPIEYLLYLLRTNLRKCPFVMLYRIQKFI